MDVFVIISPSGTLLAVVTRTQIFLFDPKSTLGKTREKEQLVGRITAHQERITALCWTVEV